MPDKSDSDRIKIGVLTCTAMLLGIILCFAVLGLRKLARAPAPSLVAVTQTEYNQLDALARQPAKDYLVYRDRPWTRVGRDGIFTFSETEWATLTNRFRENVRRDGKTGASIGFEYLAFEQGNVFRTQDMEALRATFAGKASEIATNEVWFYK